MLQPTSIDDHHTADFRQFRRKLLEFLRLPLDIRESALREALERSSANLYKKYLARAWRE